MFEINHDHWNILNKSERKSPPSNPKTCNPVGEVHTMSHFQRPSRTLPPIRRKRFPGGVRERCLTSTTTTTSSQEVFIIHNVYFGATLRNSTWSNIQNARWRIRSRSRQFSPETTQQPREQHKIGRKKMRNNSVYPEYRHFWGKPGRHPVCAERWFDLFDVRFSLFVFFLFFPRKAYWDKIYIPRKWCSGKSVNFRRHSGIEGLWKQNRTKEKKKKKSITGRFWETEHFGDFDLIEFTYPVHRTNSTLSPCLDFIACVADSSRLHGLSHMWSP